MQSAEEFADDFREWMVVNAQWPMLGDSNATKKLEQIIAARDAEWQARVDKLEAALKEYANENNWVSNDSGVCRIWREPGSKTPEVYDGYKLARSALGREA